MSSFHNSQYSLMTSRLVVHVKHVLFQFSDTLVVSINIYKDIYIYVFMCGKNLKMKICNILFDSNVVSPS